MNNGLSVHTSENCGYFRAIEAFGIWGCFYCKNVFLGLCFYCKYGTIRKVPRWGRNDTGPLRGCIVGKTRSACGKRYQVKASVAVPLLELSGEISHAINPSGAD